LKRAATGLLGAAAGATVISAPAYAKPGPRRVIILGFDGAEPSILDRLMADGKLPHLSRLREIGDYKKLSTTNPAESPVAWASFATGVHPGKHGIFDFLRRDTTTYFPDLAGLEVTRPKVMLHLFPFGSPKVRSTRGGASFWATAADRGITATLLHVPGTFPADVIPNGRVLSGLGVPDLRATNGTFFYFATDLEEEEVGSTEFGGKLVRVDVFQNEANTRIEGPRGLDDPKGKRITVPLKIEVRPAERELAVEIQGRRQIIREKAWSDWFTLEFKVTPVVSVSGVCKFYVKQIAPHVQLYMSPINLDPRKPALPISHPAEFSRTLADNLGLYKTLGWDVDTWALNEERIDEDVFLEDLFAVMAKREEIMFHTLREYPSDITVVVFSETDRVQHMFWRFVDPLHPRYDPAIAAKYGEVIDQVYQRMDKIIGKAMKYVDENTVLIVLSDHGFNSYRKGVNLNTWLVKNGFMTRVTDDVGRELGLDNLYDREDFWPDVDWSRTKAYAIGLGQIYINLAGREKHGLVRPGADYERVVREICDGLSNLVDRETGERVVIGAYPRADIYQGPFFDQAPDIQLGFSRGYRVSWQTTLGGIPEDVIQVNNKKWSSDHCSYDPSITQGIILSNRKIAKRKPSIVDIAPTVLKTFDIPIPNDYDGVYLW